MVHIALMLPFYTDHNTLEQFMADSNVLRGMSEERKKRKFETYVFPKSLVSLDLYEGILLAIKEYQKRGDLDVKLYVYDTKADSNQVKSIMSGPNLSKMDMIIGPAFHYNYQLVAQFARKHEISLVSPLSSRYLCDSNTFTLQVKPTDFIQLSTFFRHLKNRIQEGNLLMIYDTHIADYDVVPLYRQLAQLYFPPLVDSLESDSAHFTLADDSSSVTLDTTPRMIELQHGEDFRERLLSVMDSNRVNYVLVPSEREAFVTSVTSTLNALTLTHQIQLLGMPSWQQFRSFDLDEFYNLSLLYYTPYYIDWESPELIEWLKQYRDLYKTDIFRVASDGSNHVLLGYDMVSFFLDAWERYGKDFRYCLHDFDRSSMQTHFQFVQSKNGDGFCNRTITVVEYDKSSFQQKPLRKR